MISNDELKFKCEEARNLVVELSFNANSAHLGSSLSCIELVVTCLQMKKEKFADKFIMSKGHAAMALYSAANVLGYIGKEHLTKYLQDGSEIWGHPSYKAKFADFIDWSTGSLGHGLPVSVGFALARSRNYKSEKVICLLSDGELNEGTNWESILFAGHHKLNNLIVVIDYNKIQSYGFINDVLKLDPLDDKFRAFGWDVVSLDGHDVGEIITALKVNYEKPVVLIANTIKGKGIPHLENTILSHYRPASAADLKSRNLI